MASQRASIVRSPLGYAFLRGEQVAKLTDVSISYAGTEITARSGCDKTPWFRALDSYDLTGSFSTQVISPHLLALVTGGDVVAANGYDVVSDESLTTSSSPITLANTPVHLYDDADGLEYGQIALVRSTSTGDTLLTQIASGVAPSNAGDFSINSEAGEVTIHNDDLNTTITATYMYQVAGNDYFELEKDDEPAFLSLGIPLCGYKLADLDTQKATTLWIPRVKILSWDGNASTGAGDLQTFSFNFTAVPDSVNDVFRLY